MWVLSNVFCRCFSATATNETNMSWRVQKWPHQCNSHNRKSLTTETQPQRKVSDSGCWQWNEQCYLLQSSRGYMGQLTKHLWKMMLLLQIWWFLIWHITVQVLGEANEENTCDLHPTFKQQQKNHCRKKLCSLHCQLLLFFNFIVLCFRCVVVAVLFSMRLCVPPPLKVTLGSWEFECKYINTLTYTFNDVSIVVKIQMTL